MVKKEESELEKIVREKDSFKMGTTFVSGDCPAREEDSDEREGY